MQIGGDERYPVFRLCTLKRALLRQQFLVARKVGDEGQGGRISGQHLAVIEDQDGGLRHRIVKLFKIDLDGFVIDARFLKREMVGRRAGAPVIIEGNDRAS